MPTDEALWYGMMGESSKKDPLIEARKKAQQEDIEVAKKEERSFASKIGEMLSPTQPKAPQVDLAKVAEGTSQIPAISEVKEEEFEPLEVTPTTEDMQYAAQQRLQQFNLRKQLTPEDPEKATQAAGIAGEIAVGFTPAGIAIDIKDMAKAVETKDPILAAMAGIGAIPFIGDMAKGTFKALRAGDRSVETVRAGRQLLEEVDHAERLWREMHTDSPYFRKWAGEDTPVVNAGDPLPEGPVVIRAYHGTPSAEFTEFDPSLTREELGGMHFGTSDQSIEFTRPGGPPVMPLYIRMNNPLRMRDLGSWENDRVLTRSGLNADWYEISTEELIQHVSGPRGYVYMRSWWGRRKDDILADLSRGDERTIALMKMQLYADDIVSRTPTPMLKGLSENQRRHAERAIRAKAEAEFVQKTLQHHGHDGIVYRNTTEGLGRGDNYQDSYIVFEPAKIKSTSNQGTFDPSNPDIMSAAPASLAGALGDSSVA